MSTRVHRVSAGDPIPVHGARTAGFARAIRRLAVPIIVTGVAIVALLNISVPELTTVAEMHGVGISPNEAPSLVAMKRIGTVFDEFKSDSTVMIVLEGQQKLGEAAHRYYERMVQALEADTEHVESVQDFWGDPLTAAGAESADGKAAYVRVHLAGNQGEAKAYESIKAVQRILAGIAPPTGVASYVTGGAAMIADQHIAGNRSLRMIEMLTITVILVMLSFFYRSITTVLLVFGVVLLALFAARGVVAFLGYHQIIGLTTFATNLLVTLAIAASTDYVMFLVGRYQEALGNGQDPESAYYAMFGGTAHVVLASGVTIAGAIYCLRFARLPYYQSLAMPLAIGLMVVVVVALTVGSAMVTVAGRFGLLQPKRQMRVRGWRKVGAAVARWPRPILVATMVLAAIGLLALPGYHPNYNDRNVLPADLPANRGYAAAGRHFSQAEMNPELLMVESGHDLRNPADFLIIEKIAKSVLGVEGVASVRAITRPQGDPIENTSIPALMSLQSTTQGLNMSFMRDRMNDMVGMGGQLQAQIDTMTRMLAITQGLADATNSMAAKMHVTVEDVAEIRNRLADFDDVFRPIRSYFNWEPHCYDIPICSALRSLYNSIDGVDTTTGDLQRLLPDVDRVAELTPQLVAIMPQMIASLQTMHTMLLTMQATMGGLQDQMNAMLSDPTAMGRAFNTAKSADSFYLPPEAFENKEFKKGMKMFLSPNGHAVRFVIVHEGDPMAPEAMSRVGAIKTAAKEAIKGTSLKGSAIYLAGSASMYRDLANGNRYDLTIAAIAALSLIFIIMLIITRALIASVVIVGTVALSLGSSFGLSVFIWQYVLGIQLHWVVLAMSVIILLAVGADYNLLLVSRLKDEIHAGLNTGLIRAMGGSGSVVTAAGLVFAFTMMSMAISELRVIGQVGTTIGLGLLFDTLVVRAFMTPSIAVLLGRWFWWPQRHPRAGLTVPKH
jgi:RND superfamily putative drug exporter